DAAPGPAAVFRVPAGRAGQENVLVVVRIDTNLAEVVRPLAADVFVVAVHLLPCLAAVFGSINLAADNWHSSASTARRSRTAGPHVDVLDDGVEDFRILQIDVEADPADFARGKPAAEPCPVESAVGGLVDAALRTAIDHLPRQPRL